MNTVKRFWGLGVVSVLIGVALYTLSYKAPKDVPNVSNTDDTVLTTSTEQSSTTPPKNTGTTNQSKDFPIDSSDYLTNWSFSGTSSGDFTLQTKTNADIKKLTDLLGKGAYDYDLYNGIANDYASLGNGALAYQNYNKALKIHPQKGLVYMNLGHLFDELGAEHTAVSAYAKSVAMEPRQTAFWLAYLTYLTDTEPQSSLTQTTFASALSNTNQSPDVLISKANWLEDIGEIESAIAVWRSVRPSVSAQQQKAIDTKIQSLQKKL